jgi:hypothetical protein
MYQTFPQVVFRLHPQSHPLVLYPRPLSGVFLSMLPPHTRPWRPSTSTYSPLPISTIIGRRCGRTLIMPPVGIRDRGIKICYDPCTTPLTPFVWLCCTLGGEGVALPLFGGVTLEGRHLSFEQQPKLTTLYCLYRLGDRCCYFWSFCRGRAFSEISKSQGRPLHPLPHRRRPAPQIWSDPRQAPKDALPTCITRRVLCLDPTLPSLK